MSGPERTAAMYLWRSLVLLAIVAVCVRADYQVEVRFFRYWNPSHTRENGNCCEGNDCNKFCDNFFKICVIPGGGRCGDQPAPFLVERRDATLRDDGTFIYRNDDLMFVEGEEAVQGLPNPVIFNISGPWPSNPQRLLAVEIFDLDGGGSIGDDDLRQDIGGFIVDLATVSPGNSTGPVQYSNNAGIRDVDVMNTFINMSISLRCAEDSYGPECRRCVAEDSDVGHYTCDSEGFIVCREGYRNTSTNCTQCIPAQGCSDVGGYCEEPGECICRSNYTGAFCEVDLDPCSHMMPCENGATCMNSGVGDFTCACPEGLEGERCQLIRTDECANPDPCQNGGTCVDLFRDYVCECVEGYEGKNCETEIDECLSNPCSNGGTCTDQFNDYMCQCVEGYEGKSCTINIDDCQPNPCLNNGTCGDLLVDYQCSCTSGYAGRNCSEPELEERGESSSDSLDAGVAGGMAGIAVLVIIVLVLVIVLLFVLKRERRQKFVIAEKSLPGECEEFTQSTGAEGSTPTKPSKGDDDAFHHEFDNPIYGDKQEDYAIPVKPVSTSTGAFPAQGTGTGSSVEHEFGNPIYGDDKEEYATPIKPPAVLPGEEPLHEYDYTSAPSGLVGPKPVYDSADPLAYTEPFDTIRANQVEVAPPAHEYDYTTTQRNLYEDPSVPTQHYEMPTTTKAQTGLGGLDPSEHYEFGPV